VPGDGFGKTFRKNVINGWLRLLKRERCKSTRENHGVIRVNHEEWAVAGFLRDVCMNIRRFV
jgi:hypothetical protein